MYAGPSRSNNGPLIAFAVVKDDGVLRTEDKVDRRKATIRRMPGSLQTNVEHIDLGPLRRKRWEPISGEPTILTVIDKGHFFGSKKAGRRTRSAFVFQQVSVRSPPPILVIIPEKTSHL